MTTGFKEKFQDKKKFPRLPRLKREDSDTNPWGGTITPAIQRIVDERRQKRQIEKISARESSYQDFKS